MSDIDSRIERMLTRLEDPNLTDQQRERLVKQMEIIKREKHE